MAWPLSPAERAAEARICSSRKFSLAVRLGTASASRKRASASEYFLALIRSRAACNGRPISGRTASCAWATDHVKPSSTVIRPPKAAATAMAASDSRKARLAEVALSNSISHDSRKSADRCLAHELFVAHEPKLRNTQSLRRRHHHRHVSVLGELVRPQMDFGLNRHRGCRCQALV